MHKKLLFGLMATIGCHICSVGAAPVPAPTPEMTVVAIADDAQCVVMRDRHEKLLRYRRGDSIANSDWRVERVANGFVEFRSRLSFAGSPLLQRAKVGDKLSFASVTPPPLAPTPRQMIVQPVARHATKPH